MEFELDTLFKIIFCFGLYFFGLGIFMKRGGSEFALIPYVLGSICLLTVAIRKINTWSDSESMFYASLACVSVIVFEFFAWQSRKSKKQISTVEEQ